VVRETKDSEIIRRALDESRLTLEDFAAEVGLSREAIAKYRAGQRTMPPEVRLKISTFLYYHARRLERLAEDLSATVEP